MGEVAEMMMDGTLCEGCGVFLNEDPPGYPCQCSKCRRESKVDLKVQNIAAHQKRQSEQTKVKCLTCGRRVKSVGLNDHMRDAHQSKSTSNI